MGGHGLTFIDDHAGDGMVGGMEWGREFWRCVVGYYPTPVSKGGHAPVQTRHGR